MRARLATDADRLPEDRELENHAMTRRLPNVLVVPIDCQIDFVMAYGKLPVAGAEAIIAPGIKYLSELDPEEVAGALFTFDTHNPEDYLGSPENLGDEANGIPGFPMHCDKSTPGWQNVFNPRIVPAAIPVHQLEKSVFDMWKKPSEDTLVYDLAFQNGTGRERDSYFKHILPRSVDTIRIFGVASDFCVRWAIAGFLERRYKVEVVAHLTAGILRDIAQTVADEFPGRVTII